MKKNYDDSYPLDDELDIDANPEYDDSDDGLDYDDSFYKDEEPKYKGYRKNKRLDDRDDSYDDDYETDDYGNDSYEDSDIEEEEEFKGKRAIKETYRTTAKSRRPYTDYDFNEIVKNYHSGDTALRQQAIQDAIDALTGIIFKIIETKYSTYHKYMEDLIEEGKIGVMTGLAKYDPQRAKPSTFFHPFIIHEIQSFIDTNVNKTTAHYSSNIRKINKAIAYLEDRGIPYTDVDISIQTNLTMETVKQAMAIRNYRNEVNIDVCPEYYINDNAISAPIPNPESAYIEQEKKDFLYKTINDICTPTEIKVLEYSFGINDQKTLSYKEMSKELGLPTDKIKRIYIEALRKLRVSPLRETFSDNLAKEHKEVYDSKIPIIPAEPSYDDTDFLTSAEIDF